MAGPTVSLIFVVLCVVIASTQGQRPRAEDPLCIAKSCQLGETCRVIRQCAFRASNPGVKECYLEAKCLDQSQRPEFSHVGVCQIGQPILTLREGMLGDTWCGINNQCLEGTYCNTELQDTYSTCCRSDPDTTPKQGVCPADKKVGYFFCVDSCNVDKDCHGDAKCCFRDCRKECILPPLCENVQCPTGTYCRRRFQKCRDPRNCKPEGQCSGCGMLCRMFCPFGNVLDPDGCPVCKCKPNPNPPPVNTKPPVNPIRPPVNPVRPPVFPPQIQPENQPEVQLSRPRLNLNLNIGVKLRISQ